VLKVSPIATGEAAVGGEEVPSEAPSIEDAAAKFGFKAQGYAATYEQLTKLKAPVVVYLKHRKDDHFSVLCSSPRGRGGCGRGPRSRRSSCLCRVARKRA